MKFSPCVVLLASITPAVAGHQVKEVTDIESPFDKGRMELQIGTGGFFSLRNNLTRSLGPAAPDITTVNTNLRLGLMLGSPSGPGIWKGNFELLAEAYGATIVDGPGNAMIGGSLLVRYNFTKYGKWVPYIQGGGGGLWNDVDKVRAQTVIGSAFEFNLQAAGGLRYVVNNRSAWFIEAGYVHVSNADTASRNLGLNSLGGLLGFSYFF